MAFLNPNRKKPPTWKIFVYTAAIIAVMILAGYFWGGV